MTTGSVQLQKTSYKMEHKFNKVQHNQFCMVQ